MDGTVNEADVVLNQLNVALARSQRVMNSWLPAKRPEEQQSIETEDDDEDLKPMTELGGIHSIAAYDEEGLPEGAFQRKKLSINDKLMEQLIGKKAAQAKKKSQDAGKSMSTSKHAAPKPLVNRPRSARRENESEDEEEFGRAGMFKSRKPIKSSTLPDSEYIVDDSMADRPEVEHQYTESAESGPVRREEPIRALDAKPNDKATAKKNGRYLDELLAQKAAKKGKRKKQKSGVDT